MQLSTHHHDIPLLKGPKTWFFWYKVKKLRIEKAVGRKEVCLSTGKGFGKKLGSFISNLWASLAAIFLYWRTVEKTSSKRSTITRISVISLVYYIKNFNFTKINPWIFCSCMFFENVTWKPSFCRLRAKRLAPNLASSSLWF